MTVKSPFYNKPSTATSVDSCHKCPLDFTTQPKDSNVVPVSISVNEAQISHSGIAQLQVTTDRSNSNINNAAEPCSSSAAKSDIGNVSVTSCSNCGTTTTPLWRRSPKGETICNACGLYLKARNTTRPPWLKRNSTKRPTPSTPVALAPAPPTSVPIVSRISPVPIEQQQQQIVVDKMINAPSPTSSTTSICYKCTDDCTENSCQRSSLSCANCNTTTTPLWRRDAQGDTICNACGLYYKLHNVHRPMTMKRSIIKRRKRVTVSSLAAQQNGYSCSSSSSDESDIDGRKRKASSRDDYRPAKRMMELPVLAAKYLMRPLLPHQPSSPPAIIAPKPHLTASAPPSSSTQNEARLDPVEPDAFQKRPMHLPSPPMKPVSNIAQLLNPDKESKSRCSLPSISLPSLPSPPLTAHEMFKEPTSSGAVKQQERPKQDNNSNSNNQNSSAVAAAAALATVSALLNPTVNPQQTHQMLEAHRHELQREVTNLTSLLTRTTAMLQNLDQVMAVAGTVDQQKNSGVANALMSLFALANDNKNNNKEQHMPLTPPSDHHHHHHHHHQHRSMDARV